MGNNASELIRNILSPEKNIKLCPSTSRKRKYHDKNAYLDP